MPKHELQNIISGTGSKTEEDIISTIAHQLSRSKEAGEKAKGTEYSKGEETKSLINFKGTEQKVYFNPGAGTFFYLSKDFYKPEF